MSATTGATDGFRPSTDGSRLPDDEYDKVARDAEQTARQTSTRHPAEYLPTQGNS